MLLDIMIHKDKEKLIILKTFETFENKNVPKANSQGIHGIIQGSILIKCILRKKNRYIDNPMRPLCADRLAAVSVMDPAQALPGHHREWWYAWLQWREERRRQRPWDADGWDTEGPIPTSTIPPAGDYTSAFRGPPTTVHSRTRSRSIGSD